MRQQTELMRHILKSKKGQEIIDWVAPVYGDSYVGLWIFEAIGRIMGELCDTAEGLRYEVTPATAELLLDYWEDHYDVPRDLSLTTEQRRARLIAKTWTRGPANPYRVSEAVSAALLGIPVEIIENTAKNTFQLHIMDAVKDFKRLKNAITVLQRLKPAHLIYTVNVTSQVDETLVKLASIATFAETYHLGTKAVVMQLESAIESEIKVAAATTLAEKMRLDTETPALDVTAANLESTINVSTGTSLLEDISTEAGERPALDLSGTIDSNILLATALSQAENLTPDEIKQVAHTIAEDFAAVENES